MKQMAMKESTRQVFDYVKSMEGQNITANDISDATGIPVRSVTGSVTSFCKKGLMERKAGEAELPDGTHKPIKLIFITEKGKAFNPDENNE
ncbi:MAG: SarR-like protein [Caudoviricetes sp.]|nr:MAG: SarR-like protein [Caudoviricetes sp.]